MSERFEQATAAPGEVRNVELPDSARCWKSTGVGFERCHLLFGHFGECDSTRHVTDGDAATAGDERG